MSDELKKRVELLETQLKNKDDDIEILTNKINEIVSCLEDNTLFRKFGVDYIRKEEEAEEDEEEAEEETEEKPKEKTE